MNPTMVDLLTSIGDDIFVVADDGELVAHGSGRPPAFVRDSSMAEAWALFLMDQFAMEPPRVVTDCLSLLKVADGGDASASAASRPCARVW